MDIKTFIIEMVKTLAWPVVFFYAIYILFKKPNRAGKDSRKYIDLDRVNSED